LSGQSLNFLYGQRHQLSLSWPPFKSKLIYSAIFANLAWINYNDGVLLRGLFLRVVGSVIALLSFQVKAGGAEAPSDPKLQIFDERFEPVNVHDCQVFVRTIAATDSRVESKKSSAPPAKVIAINGIPASSWIYRDFAIRLSKLGRRVDLVDLPGTGQSTLAPPTKWPRQSDCIKKFLQQEKAPYILALHDIAGPMVLPLLSSLPNVSGLMVMNTILKTSSFKPIAPMSTLKHRFLGDIATLFMGRSKLHKEIKKIGLSKEVDDFWLDQIFNDLRKGGAVRRLSSILRSFEGSKSLDSQIALNVSQFMGPKVAVWGLADPALGGLSFYAKGLFGESNYVEIPEAKHFLMMDHPEELSKVFTQYFH